MCLLATAVLPLAAVMRPRGEPIMMSALSGGKVHTSTVALVPPESVWSTIQSTRLNLRDRGLFRWPPHINLLYPFVPEDELASAIQLLQPALDDIQPLATCITLDALGTFGGRSRGVLYACCSSPAETAALQILQGALQAAIPFCDDQQKRGEFTPHLTLAHFESRDAAEAAKTELLRAKMWTSVTFDMTGCVHVMRRVGGSGQFERAFTLSPVAGAAPLAYEPPRPFDAMPREEEEWMQRARKEAYKREGSSGSRTRRRRPRRTPEERAAILARTPEDIAAIRAERAAKRARLQQQEETGRIEQRSDSSF